MIRFERKRNRFIAQLGHERTVAVGIVDERPLVGATRNQYGRTLGDAAFARRLGKAGQAFARERFRWPEQARKLDAFLRRVTA